MLSSPYRKRALVLGLTDLPRRCCLAPPSRATTPDLPRASQFCWERYSTQARPGLSPPESTQAIPSEEYRTCRRRECRRLLASLPPVSFSAQTWEPRTRPLCVSSGPRSLVEESFHGHAPESETPGSGSSLCCSQAHPLRIRLPPAHPRETML